MKDNPQQLRFIEVQICTNPMESEIYTAALRESDIPHRTEWTEDGKLVLMVAAGWQEQAAQSLDRASMVFFNEKRKEHSRETRTRKISPQNDSEAETSENDSGTVIDPNVGEAEQDDTDDLQWGRPMFISDALPTPEETRLRAVWPAWALAAIPGLGLGHLYAGKMQMFFYLIFCSLLGGLFFRYTGSIWSFGLIGFSWAVDLGFSAYHVTEHNRLAARASKRLKQAEKEFYDSLPGGGANERR